VPTVADSTYGASAGMFKVVVSISDVKDVGPGLSCTAENCHRDYFERRLSAHLRHFPARGCYFVYPARGGGKTQADVKVGKSSDEFVEILGGVEPA